MSDLLTGKNFIIIPRVKTTDRLALVATNGMLVYDTDINSFYKYENGSWSTFAGGGGFITSVTDTNTLDLDVTGGALTANLKKDFVSGLVSGGVVSVNADPSKFDISSGTGVIVDFWTSPGNPVFYAVTIPASTANTLTYLATSTLSYIGIDKNGTIVQYSSEPTNAQRRDVILLAQIGHTNNTSIGAINSFVSAYGSTIEQLRDVISELHLVSSGNIITANGANLKIDKSDGYLFGLGINYRNNTKDPHRVNTAALSALTFRYRTQTGAGANTSDIDPTSYDNAGTITAIGGSGNQATNQRIYLFPNNNIVIQYGQTVYNSLTSAISGVQNETFNKYVNVDKAGILIGILSVTKGCTDLTGATNARFLRVSRFGEEIGSSAGISVTTLQNAYNNSLTPEILTDSSRGAVSIKRGSAADTDDVIEVLNNGGSQTFAVTGNGKIFTASETASTIASIDANREITSLDTTTYPSLTELSYVKGVTSAIQTQLNAKGSSVHGGIYGTITAGLTRYAQISTLVGTVSATENTRQSIMARDGSFTAMVVNTSNSQPATGSLVITLRKNAANTALTITIAAGSAAGIFSVTATSSFTAFTDAYAIEYINNATTVSATVLGVTLKEV